MQIRFYNKFFLVLTFVCIINSACENKTDSELKNRSIIIPQTWLSIESSTKNPTIDNETTIIAYINGDCYTCIEELKKWKQIVEDNKNVKFIFFTDTYNLQILIRFIHTNEFKQNIFYDKEEAFWKKNGISLRKKVKSILLIKGKIELEGDFINFPEKIKGYINL